MTERPVPDEAGGAPSFKDHFSAHAADYAAYRPTYPDALVDFLADLSPGHDLALDCACGAGQFSVLVARRFDRVVATDASQAQIASARPCGNVQYRVALAEHSGLDDASADLITVAQAAHWLELAAFYAEARRVARPRAIVALISYGMMQLEEPAGAVVHGFYHDVVGMYWPAERRHVENGYRDLPFPFPELTAPAMAIRVSWTRADFIGYVRTWSAVRAAERAGKEGLVEALDARLAGVWGEPGERRTVTWPLSLRVGRIA